MAFTKRTWLARLGTGLNKFIIGAVDGDGKQTLTNSPDTITQQGDVISAGNLNDLESRIEGAVTDLETSKQDVLTFDSTPMSGSPRPVTSGGLYTAFASIYSSTLLWTNSDPSADFGAQYVTLSSAISNFHAVVVVYYDLYSNTNVPVCSEYIPCYFSPSGKLTKQLNLSAGLGSTYSVYYRALIFNNSSTTVEVGQCFYSKIESGAVSQTLDNAILIPYKIYGITYKGV